MSVSIEARRLGWILGLGDLEQQRRCFGYQNCCACPRCHDREDLAILADKRRVDHVAEHFGCSQARVEQLRALRAPPQAKSQPWDVRVA